MNNNWYVITGAPSGKTTIIKALGKKGYKVFDEWARVYIDQELEKGRTISEIRADEKKFQKKILDLKVDFEKNLNPKDVLFMDRGIPDTIAYNKLIGAKDPDIKNILKNCYYKKVFLLELGKYEQDYARTESEEEAMLIDQLLEEAYKKIKTEIVRVPKMSTEERVQFIFKNIK